VLALLGLLVWESVAQVQQQAGKYRQGYQQLLGVLNEYALTMNIDLDIYMDSFYNQVTTWLPKIFTETAKGLGYAFFICIFLVYLLLSPVLPAPNNVWGQIDLHLRRWIRLKTIICLTVGVCTAALLSALRVDLALVFGLLAFILNYVPNVGPTAATLLPCGLALLDPTLGTAPKVLVFALPTALHMAVGNFVEPLVMGEHLDLHPVCVLLAMAFWLILWGVPGMLMAVPLVSMLRIVCLHLEHPYSNVMVLVFEGRFLEAYAGNPFPEDSPAGTPVRSWSHDVTPVHGGGGGRRGNNAAVLPGKRAAAEG
ncbi:unnamed protein product, partial [Heterosigma akashiwo]